jgi:3-hydroxyisobutyrate dehydrogenase-like beta-hydroxyacid dehydrogenase
MARKLNIGVVGVGKMGSAMVGRLVGNGRVVNAFDIDSNAMKNATMLGANAVDSSKEIAGQSEVALLSLPMPADVELVVTGPDGLLAKPGRLRCIVDLSTIDPFTTQKNAVAAEKLGIGYLDAPVLGRPQNCGKWTLAVGGKAEDIEECKEVLALLAANVVNVGPSGWGNVVKLLNNMMFGAINAVTAEVFAICREFGMSPKVFYDTVANSGAATVSGLFRESGSKIVSRNFDPVFTVDLLHKDMTLGIEMARKLGVPLLVSDGNQRVNEIAKALKLGKEDTSSVIKVYEKMLGIEESHGATSSGVQ